MHIEFATATRILFGAGRQRELGGLTRACGRHALIIAGRTKERPRQVTEILAAENVAAHVFHLSGEPTVHDVREGARLAREENCDCVIGLGGGSALDAAKAIAALLTNPGDLFDYLEVVGRAQPLRQPSAPCITVPTTAGTGAEVTRNAVLASPEHRFKVSLRSPFLLPKLALVDPELTYELPPHLTATTGLDALTQLIEPYVSHRANPLTDGFCTEGLRRAARSLIKAYTDGHDTQAREDMALASLLSGLSLANAALGAVHGFAAPLGGTYSAPHGAFCAALLPHTMKINIQALRQRQPDSVALQRYRELARILTGSEDAAAENGVQWVSQTCSALGIKPLRALGVEAAHFPELVGKAAQSSSMKGNPILLTEEEMREILERAF